MINRLILAFILVLVLLVLVEQLTQFRQFNQIIQDMDAQGIGQDTVILNHCVALDMEGKAREVDCSEFFNMWGLKPDASE